MMDKAGPRPGAATYSVRVWKTKADADAGAPPIAWLRGMERRDPTLLLAARCVLGLDMALPGGEVATVTRDGGTGRAKGPWTLTRGETPRFDPD